MCDRRQTGSRSTLLRAWVVRGVTCGLCGLAAWLLTGGAAAAAGVDAPPAPRRVGTAVCQTCHLDYARVWAGLKHSKAMLADDVPAEKQGCEGCHGPGGDHIGRNRKAIRSWKGLEAEDAAKVCLQCHQKQGLSEELWFARDHSQLLECSACHEVHRPVKREKLLRRDEGKDCAPCHDDLAAKIKQGEHHILADGALACGDCHAFHGTKNSHLLSKPQGELCKSCHEDDVPKPPSHKRADFRLKHKAEAKGQDKQCLKCHDRETFCNQCHAVKVPHPDDFAEKHEKEAKAQPKACLNCHEAKYCGMCHDPLPKPFDTLAGKAK